MFFRYAAVVADIWVTAFLPDEWSDFVSLADALFPDGVSLWRWEEESYVNGRRSRTIQITRDQAGPALEDVVARAVRHSRAHGFRLEKMEDETTTLEDDSRVLALQLSPLPPRITMELVDRLTQRGAENYPAIAELFRMAAQAGAASFWKLRRFAELDLETHTRFFPPQTEMTAKGTYDRTALCTSLAAAGFAEDGDAWIRERHPVRDEVRLRDDSVVATVIPQHLAR